MLRTSGVKASEWGFENGNLKTSQTMQGVYEEWFYSQSFGFIYVSPPNREAVKRQNAHWLRVWNGLKHWKLIVVNLWMKEGATADSQQPGAALQQPLSLMKRKRSARGAEVDLSSQHFNGACLHLIRPPDGHAATPPLPLWPEQQQDAGQSELQQETTTEAEGSNGCSLRSRRTIQSIRDESWK